MKKIIFNILGGVLFLSTIVVSIYNIMCDKEHFFEISIAQMLTVLVALGIAFWASQYENDRRKAKEHVEKMLIKLQEMVSANSFCSIPSTGDTNDIRKNINITNRKINNYINILKKYGKTLGFTKYIDYIDSEFDSYKKIIGDHINDLDYLSKTESEFRRIASNIELKSEFIIHSLYK